MKKVNICTLTGNGNYGNKLQHFALQSVLEKFDLEVESTLFIYNNFFVFYFNRFLKLLLKNIIPTRFVYFSDFDKKIHYSKNFVYKNKLIGNSKYDYYVVGSDQVWNTSFPAFNLMYLLKNVNNCKKISYAASIGINYIKTDYCGVFKEELKKFSYISVREDKAMEIIKDLDSSLNPIVLVDPTLLLSFEEWSLIAKKPKNLKNQKFILNYFLGDLDSTIKKKIDSFAKKENCIIINLLDQSDPFYRSGPSEFLWLEKNAFLICTDSFHASVFGLLFNRPFIIFDRQDKEEKMNSRLDTLINKFKLKNRKFEGKITEENLNHDYSEAYKILEEERKKSEVFLKKALDIKE